MARYFALRHFREGLDTDAESELTKEYGNRASITYLNEPRRREGHEERGKEALELVLRLLKRRLGVIEPEIQQLICQLSVTQLEELGEALLDFASVSDLTNWLETHSA